MGTPQMELPEDAAHLQLASVLRGQLEAVLRAVADMDVFDMPHDANFVVVSFAKHQRVQAAAMSALRFVGAVEAADTTTPVPVAAETEDGEPTNSMDAIRQLPVQELPTPSRKSRYGGRARGESREPAKTPARRAQDAERALTEMVSRKSQGCTAYAIARDLNTMGLTNQWGKPFTGSAVASTITKWERAQTNGTKENNDTTAGGTQEVGAQAEGHTGERPESTPT